MQTTEQLQARIAELESELARKQRTRASAFGVDGRVKNQEIHSPQWIIDAVKQVARDSGRKLIDPCASSDQNKHFADVNYTEADDGIGLNTNAVWYQTARDSILYVNPPYNRLTRRANESLAGSLPWLEACANSEAPSIVLCPIRLNRERDSGCLQAADKLYAVKRSSAVFAGYRGTLATPLCVAVFHFWRHGLKADALDAVMYQHAVSLVSLAPMP